MRRPFYLCPSLLRTKESHAAAYKTFCEFCEKLNALCLKKDEEQLKSILTEFPHTFVSFNFYRCGKGSGISVQKLISLFSQLQSLKTSKYGMGELLEDIAKRVEDTTKELLSFDLELQQQ
jgi:hypothetical protein